MRTSFTHLRLQLAVLLGCLALAGCHRAPKEPELPAALTAPIAVQAEPAVGGDLAGAMEIVPGTYQVSVSKQSGTLAGYETTVKVKVHFTKQLTVKAGSGYNSFGPELKARLLDASGAPIDGADDLYTKASLDGNLAPLLKQGSGEEWLSFRTVETFAGYSDAERAELPAKATKYLAALQAAKKISLTSTIVAEKFEGKPDKDMAAAMAESEAKVAAAKEELTSTASGADCDAFLEGYEQYVNDYVALAKEMQANPSDATLLTKSSEMSLKATEWAGKAKGCDKDPAFQAKYAALSAKIATGMASAR